MIFYEAHFEHGLKELITLSVMSTEQYRLANGGKSNVQLALEQIKKQYPNRKLLKLVRTSTGQTVWPS